MLARIPRVFAATLALAAPLPALAQETGELVRFITCPVYRDTDAGRKSGCWLADERESGQRFDVSRSPTKPDWNFGTLVEGRVTEGDEDLCGGTVLDPVRTATLRDMPCPRHMLPAEEFPGRPYVLEGRFIMPMAVPRDVPPGPYEETVFPVFFEFDRDFLIYQYDDYLLDRAVTWLRAANPTRVVVTGYAATQPETVSGYEIAEDPDIARTRAEVVALTLRRMMPDLEVETRWEVDSQPVDLADADTMPGQSQRRAEIRAIFD